jgi:hypothetical protein
VALLELKFQTGFVWYYWLLPSLLGQPFLRFYLIAEHNGCKTGENMLNNTRTTVTYWWYRRLAWNMPYHAEHHAYPCMSGPPTLLIYCSCSILPIRRSPQAYLQGSCQVEWLSGRKFLFLPNGSSLPETMVILRSIKN